MTYLPTTERAKNALAAIHAARDLRTRLYSEQGTGDEGDHALVGLMLAALNLPESWRSYVTAAVTQQRNIDGLIEHLNQPTPEENPVTVDMSKTEQEPRIVTLDEPYLPAVTTTDVRGIRYLALWHGPDEEPSLFLTDTFDLAVTTAENWLPDVNDGDHISIIEFTDEDTSGTILVTSEIDDEASNGERLLTGSTPSGQPFLYRQHSEVFVTLEVTVRLELKQDEWPDVRLDNLPPNFNTLSARAQSRLLEQGLTALKDGYEEGAQVVEVEAHNRKSKALTQD